MIYLLFHLISFHLVQSKYFHVPLFVNKHEQFLEEMINLSALNERIHNGKIRMSIK